MEKRGSRTQAKLKTWAQRPVLNLHVFKFFILPLLLNLQANVQLYSYKYGRDFQKHFEPFYHSHMMT